MIHPGVSDIAELGAFLFPRFPRVAYEVVSFMLLTNNIFISMSTNLDILIWVFQSFANAHSWIPRLHRFQDLQHSF